MLNNGKILKRYDYTGEKLETLRHVHIIEPDISRNCRGFAVASRINSSYYDKNTVTAQPVGKRVGFCPILGAKHPKIGQNPPLPQGAE
jgi:hypothetical protein